MTTTPAENAALVQRFLSDVVAGRDTAAVDTFLAQDVTDHNLVFGDGAPSRELTTLGWRVLAAAGDVDVRIRDVVATQQRVAVRATIAGVHRESLMDLAPTGRSFTIPYAWFCRIDDGRIAEIWSLPDGFGLLRQLEALPQPPSDRPFSHSDNDPEYP